MQTKATYLFIICFYAPALVNAAVPLSIELCHQVITEKLDSQGVLDTRLVEGSLRHLERDGGHEVAGLRLQVSDGDPVPVVCEFRSDSSLTNVCFNGDSLMKQGSCPDYGSLAELAFADPSDTLRERCFTKALEIFTNSNFDASITEDTQNATFVSIRQGLAAWFSSMQNLGSWTTRIIR